MKLASVKLRNFRGYKEETIIPIHDITAFIGKNDVGKSTILEALEIFFNNTLIECERDDLNIFADDRLIEISCVFSQLPDRINIDSSVETTLEGIFA
ncbi:MAG: AAA family ATPase [Saccharofermentanales bacterium]